MNLDQTIIFLKEKFSKNFTYKYEYNPDDFIPRYKLFADEKYIGIITEPGEMFLDIYYMFKLGYCKLPTNFNSLSEFAEHETKAFLEESVKRMLVN